MEGTAAFNDISHNSEVRKSFCIPSFPNNAQDGTPMKILMRCSDAKSSLLKKSVHSSRVPSKRILNVSGFDEKLYSKKEKLNGSLKKTIFDLCDDQSIIKS